MATVPPLHSSMMDTGTNVYYRRLNPTAPHTVLFLPGAVTSSSSLSLFSGFASSHSDLSLLCVDRWADPLSIPLSGPALLSSYTAAVMELISHLAIPRLSLAAHSAGAYPLLSLLASELEIEHTFLISTHIPTSYTHSRVMGMLSSAPGPVFRTILAVDQMDPSGPVVNTVLGWFGKADQPDARLVVSAEARKAFRDLRLADDETRRAKQAGQLDYEMSHARMRGLGDAQQREMYAQLGKAERVMWFTTDGEVFFGPREVARVLKDVGGNVQVVNVPGATHADIWLRLDVWESIYRTVTGSEAEEVVQASVVGAVSTAGS